MSAAVDWSLANVYDPTALLAFTTTGAWDTVLYNSYYGNNGLLGWHRCPESAQQGGSHPRHYCMDGEIRWNLSYTATFDTQNERRGIVCHELGHSIGLSPDPPMSGEARRGG